jgi:hypothetical protein
MVDIDSITDEEYFAAMKMMFQTDGWQIMMQELKQQSELIGDIQDIKSIESLHFNKGQLNAIGKILNFQDILARAEKETDEGS